MSQATKKPFGSWSSPIAASQIAGSVIRLSQPQWDGENLFWIEGRPLEGGRSVIVKRSPAGNIEDVLPAPFNARTRVHEYGGGDYLVYDDTIYFSNFSDQKLHVLKVGGEPKALAGGLKQRFADYSFDKTRQRVFAVMEVHGDEEHDVTNSIVSVDTMGEVTPLAEGYDFYANPRISPDGRFACYIAWNHPNMPWDGTDLFLVELDKDARAKSICKVRGGENLSVIYPEWGADGTLYFVSDDTGYWNLYELNAENLKGDLTEDSGKHAKILYNDKREHSLPPWVFGNHSYRPLDDGRILLAANDCGMWELSLLKKNTAGGVDVEKISTPYTSFNYVGVSNNIAAMCAGSPESFNALVLLDLKTHKCTEIRATSDLTISKEHISQPETIEFKTENGKTAFAFFYKPKNKDFEGMSGELPPLIVFSHGGPTGATSNVFNLSVQFWTSRGFAIVDVNYGGSTGFGREYRERLNGNWGVVDMQDCENAARHLASEGLVDKNRMAIAGGSAGGYTTLCALTFGNVFRAGASHFGVSDLEALASDTHKFEARYLDRIVGDYPKDAAIYKARSPINHTDKLSCPIIFLQGSEDKVVPPAQSESMVEALKKKGLPVAYVLFEGEQHGFRQAQNISRALEAELYFYSRVFHFDLADKIEPVEIINADAIKEVAAKH